MKYFHFYITLYLSGCSLNCARISSIIIMLREQGKNYFWNTILHATPRTIVCHLASEFYCSSQKNRCKARIHLSEVHYLILQNFYVHGRFGQEFWFFFIHQPSLVFVGVLVLKIPFVRWNEKERLTDWLLCVYIVYLCTYTVTLLLVAQKLDEVELYIQWSFLLFNLKIFKFECRGAFGNRATLVLCKYGVAWVVCFLL